MRPPLPHLAVCLLLVTLAAGQNTKLPAGPNNSAPNTQPNPNKSKPSAGIPLTTAKQHKRDDPEDRRIARQIHQSLTKDKCLSVYAGNVAIICQNGTVTLRGPVSSEVEKQNVEEKAAGVVGSKRITSELAVRPVN